MVFGSDEEDDYMNMMFVDFEFFKELFVKCVECFKKEFCVCGFIKLKV